MAGNMQQGWRYVAQYLAPFLAVLVFVLFLPAVQALGLEMPLTLIEKAGESFFSPGQAIPVQAMVSDPLGVFAVRCYFRYQRDADFVFIDMARQENGLYQGILPEPAKSMHEVEYLYLVVNARRQVVRTPVYTVNDREVKPLPLTAPGGNERSAVQTDLAVPPGPASLLFGRDHVKVTTAAAAERFGMVAGLYNNSVRDAGDKVAEGYFGAFELQPDGKYIPIKGIISLQEKVSAPAQTGTTPLRSAEEPPPPKIIGPDIAGETWEGFCYYGYGEGDGLWLIWDPTPVTATVTHVDNAVTITLSTECVINFENVGQYFQGSMDWAGAMYLEDQRDPVQIWSSHWGPVTESEIKIGDYVVPPTEEEPFPDYYVIELTREYPPPPPPPPPPNYSFLPAVYRLLLPKAP
ncbi:MAG: hypothetical protein ACYC9M_13035 [Desulfobulbaceae bacterium]